MGEPGRGKAAIPARIESVLGEEVGRTALVMVAGFGNARPQNGLQNGS